MNQRPLSRNSFLQVAVVTVIYPANGLRRRKDDRNLQRFGLRRIGGYLSKAYTEDHRYEI